MMRMNNLYRFKLNKLNTCNVNTLKTNTFNRCYIKPNLINYRPILIPVTYGQLNRLKNRDNLYFKNDSLRIVKRYYYSILNDNDNDKLLEELKELKKVIKNKEINLNKPYTPLQKVLLFLFFLLGFKLILTINEVIEKIKIEIKMHFSDF